jgi:hypothetical protein
MSQPRHEPAASAPATAPQGRWTAHPVWATLLRVVIFLIPISCALFVTWSAQQVLPIPQDAGDRLLWWVTLLGLGLAVALSAERLARRLLPLATLLQLAMLFPDRAPSRFRVARQAGSVRQLEATAASGAEGAASAEEILALVARLSAHDRRTRGHAERVRVYTDLIASEMALPEADRYRLRWAALLHDIGKLSVEADILNKTDPLTEDEWEAIRRHPHEGVSLIGPLAEWLGPWAKTIAHHHERYDGAGYPEGLAGEQIWLGARIVAVADAYDTMTSVRSYKLPVATRAAREELVACSGGQFDPWVVRSFLAVSLPRLLWATGPVSLLVHVPFLARLQVAGQVGITTAAQAVTVTAAAAVIATGLVGPLDRPARVSADPPIERTVSRTEAERARNLDPQRGAEAHDERDKDDEGKGDGKGDGGNRNEDPSPDEPDGVTQPPPDDGPDATPSPEPSPTPPPEDKTSPSPPPPTTATVPDVVGMSTVDATKALEQAGFVVKVAKTWNTDKTLKNIVYAQSEPAGSELELGSTVTVSVWKWRNSG